MMVADLQEMALKMNLVMIKHIAEYRKHLQCYIQLQVTNNPNRSKQELYRLIMSLRLPKWQCDTQLTCVIDSEYSKNSQVS